MKKWLKIITIPTILLLLSGCDANIVSKVNVSDLVSKNSKQIGGDIYINVGSCGDYKDSRKPSATLLKAQTNTPFIFADAKYKECFRKNFSSYAHFTIPIDIVKNFKKITSNHINIISQGNNLLYVSIPKQMKNNIQKVKASDKYTFNMFNLNVAFQVTNDTNQDIKMTTLATYVEDIPYIYGKFISKKGSKIVVKLSDVSVDALLKTDDIVVLMK